MRILHIVQRYWPIRGGAEIHLGEISSRLAADGHRVTVATTDAQDFELFWDPRRRRMASREAWHAGVRILRFPVRHLPVPRLTYPGVRRLLWLLSGLRLPPVSLLSRLARYTPWVPDLWSWLERTDEAFDLIAGMTITFEPLLEAGLRFARRHDVPFVVYPLTHLGAGRDPGTDALGRFYTMRHQVDLVRRSDAIVAQTPTERSFYIERGVPSERVHAVGPGFDPAALLGGDGQAFRRRYALHSPIAFMLTKMTYDKGATHTVEAARRLWDQGREFHLVLAGDVLSPFKSFFDRLPTEVRKRILLLGPVSEQEKKDLVAFLRAL